MPVQPEDITKSIDAVIGFFEKKKRKANIEKLVSSARERGDKITLTVDPATGTVTPKIETQDAGQAFDFGAALEGGGVLKSVSTRGVGTIGFPEAETQRKQAASRKQFIETAEILLTQPEKVDQFAQGGKVTLSRGEIQQSFDISGAEGMERALQFKFGADFREAEDMQHLGTLIDELKAKREQKAVDVKQAKKEKKVQPFTEKVLERIGAKGAAFKDAVEKYGKETTKKIVDVIIKAQKNNVPLSKIEADLRAKGFDPDLFLKDVK